MGIIAGLLCLVFGTGLWAFSNTMTVTNESMVTSVAQGGMVVMFAMGIALVVGTIMRRR
jgi:predicted phage tail protein